MRALGDGAVLGVAALSLPAYRLRDVQVERRSRTVLDVASLEIEAGRLTVVVGPNGAGKTTLLRLLAFLHVPSAGTIEFEGAQVDYASVDLTPLRRRTTLVAQSPLLFQRSVFSNVAYGLRARGLNVRERVDHALAAVGLGALAERPAAKLSGGETQRVAIARALAIDPPVYLFDEPTANIDAKSVPAIESLLVGLSARGKTVVLSTHNLEQAHRLSNLRIALEDGSLREPPLLNVLTGVPERWAGRSYFASAGLRIEMPDDSLPREIAISADDIIVSRAPLESSARNCFAGTVTEVTPDERGVVLTVDCGRALRAHITRHSLEEMRLGVGSQVFLTFKASAVQRR